MSNPDFEGNLSVYAQLEEFINGIQHYDLLQCLVRRISIALLMGTFGSIGYLLSIDSGFLPFSPISISIFICLFSIFFNIILFCLDSVFIERLLVSVFFNARQLEEENPWLFPIHSHMIDFSKKHHGSVSKKVQFYIGYGQDLLFLLFVCVSFLLGLDRLHWIVFLILPLFVIFVFLYSYFFKLIALRSERRLYEGFDPRLEEKAEWKMMT